MIPNEVIDQIRERDLVSILMDEGLPLKREGANYKCCCPFHDEKTPSFVVSPSRNIAHCFGESKSWDAIGFVMDSHHMNFYEAVEYLAKKLHIEYQQREETPEEREAKFKREQLININRVAQEWFVAQAKAAPAAQNYIKERGWSEKTVSLFGVGYAPAAGGLVKYLMEKGWKKELILEASLASLSEDGRYYDFFRERITFPLYSNTGQIVGFSGRYIGDKEDVQKKMKYLNSRETPIYEKRKLLFGWFQAARQVAAQETIIVCEGNPDVMRMHQIGVSYTVAPCGTALTPEHIDFLKQKAKTALILGDMDKSGIEATIKHGIEFLKARMAVRVMVWEYEKDSGAPKDPDEYFKLHPSGWEEALASRTRDFIPWYAERQLAAAHGQAEVASAITEIAGLMAFCDATVVDMYLERFIKDYKNAKVWRSEYYKAKNVPVQVIGCPKTIDGDLKNGLIETSFGFDTATKVYSEVIGNIERDCNSAKKYWHFIKLMGRSASHIALECALQTQPNCCIISEEVEAKNMTLNDIVDSLAKVVAARAAQGNNFGTVLIPEGLIEFIPAMKALIAELNDMLAANPQFASLSAAEQREFVLSHLSAANAEAYASLPEGVARQLSLDRDPHGNVQVSLIETEKLLSEMVGKRLAQMKKEGTYVGKFAALHHFFGYEGRCADPSNFDADYCYGLGYNAAQLINCGATGYMSSIRNLTKPSAQWVAGGIPITMMMNMEHRNGKNKPVIKKALVDLEGKPFKAFAAMRDEWALNTCYTYPGPIQYFGPEEVCDQPSRTLYYEQN